MPLSDVAIRKLRASDKTQRIFDGAGLYLEVSPAGGKWWRLKYRFQGKEKRLSLGVYPATGLAQARIKRDEARKLLARDIDPAVQRKAIRAAGKEAASNSFEVIAREWLAVRQPEWTEQQFEKERDRLQNHAFPWIGKLPIREVGVSEIRSLLDRIVRRGHLEQAHRLRFQLSRVFKYAVAAEYTDRDPAADLSATLPARRKQNYPTITDPKKVGGLLRAIDGFDGTFVVACALKLAPMLFVRPGELRGAEWPEFELDHDDSPRWSIPPARRKLRKAQKEDPKTPSQTVPLPTQAVAILKELHLATGSGRYLFPGARSRKRPISDMTINAALRRLGYDRDTLTGHGFRHMASTLLNELGFKAEAIERQLSHKEPGVRGIYNKAEYLPERIKMMQAWADYLDALRQDDGKLAGIRRPIRRKTAPMRKAG